MSKKVEKLLLVVSCIAVASCSMTRQQSNQDLFQPVPGLSVKEQFASKTMYNYLLGQIAGVHSTLAEQDRDEEKVAEYLDIAVPNLVEASTNIEDAELAEHATKAAAFSRRYDLTLQAAQRWIELQPNESRAHQYATIAALRLGDEESAITYLSYVVELAPTVDDGLLDVGALLSREEEREPALTVTDQLVKTYADSATAYFMQASVLLRFDEKEQALEKLDKALERKPDDRNVKLLKATVLQRINRPQEALDLLKKEIEADPDDMEVRTAYARMLISERRYADARDQYESLFKANPNNVDLAYRLGMLTLELRQLDLADKYFMHVLRSGKRTFETLYHLGRLAETRDEFKEALQYYMRVTEGEYRLDALMREAKMLSMLGQLEEGMAAIDNLQASNTDPGLDIRFYLAKIDILAHHKDYQRSYDVTNEAIKKHASEFDLLFTRSMLSEKLGNIEESIADLEYLLKKEPDNPDLLNALGYTLANRTEQYDRARELIEKALQLKPDSAAIADSMGWVLYKQGEIDEAERYIRKAYDLDPDPEIAAHLGEILWVKGQQEKANAIWQKALQKDPSHEVLNAVIKQYIK